MLKTLHKHLNSPNTSTSIIIPILYLGYGGREVCYSSRYGASPFHPTSVLQGL